MWSREGLKTRAKAVLKISYWKAFLVSIIIAVVGGNGGGGGNFNFNSGNKDFGGKQFGHYGDSFFSSINPVWISTIIGIAVLVFLLVMAFRILLGYPLEVGGRRFFVKTAQGNDSLDSLAFSFNKGNYYFTIKTMFFRDLYNFLWTLLFIIPGIVKAYAYRMVPYILADNPNLGHKRAIELSNKMTKGHKFDMFVLDLSFIGWYLLGMLALVVGILFVMPYENATKAELYLALRENAINSGITTAEELNLQPVIEITE